MIGPLGFAARNIRRRGFHTLLAFLALTITIASTSFLLVIGQTLTSRLGIDTNSKSTLGITWLLTGYIQLSLVLVLIIGLLSASHLVMSMVDQRSRDIGVIKAAGCMIPRLYAYSLNEALLVFLGSSIIGGILGLILSLSWLGGFGLGQPETSTLVGIPILAFITSYLVARLQIGRIIRASTINSISSNLDSIDLSKIGKPFHVKRFGASFNLAGRTLLRNRHFARTVLRIGVCIFLTTIILTGVLVSWDTSKSYVARAVPGNTLIVGTPAMVDAYRQLGLSFSNSGDANPRPMNYLAPANLINSSIVEKLRSVSGVEKVDTRLVNMTIAEGYVKPQIVEEQLLLPTYQGSAQLLMIGIDPNQTVSNWYTSDGFLTTAERNGTVAVVGDSLIGGIVQQPLNNSQIAMLNIRFDVKSAVVDPLNRGYVAYVPIGFIQKWLGVNEYNLLLVRTDGSTEARDAMVAIAGRYGLSVESQELVLSSDTVFLDSLWASILVLPILTMILTSIILMSYLSTNYSLNFNDYVTLKTLGARAGYRLRLLLWEGLGIIGFCALLAVPLGLVASILFILPEATTQPVDLAIVTVLSTILLSGVSILAALIYWRRLGRMDARGPG